MYLQIMCYFNVYTIINNFFLGMKYNLFVNTVLGTTNYVYLWSAQPFLVIFPDIGWCSQGVVSIFPFLFYWHK